jgi:hypothetical protein
MSNLLNDIALVAKTQGVALKGSSHARVRKTRSVCNLNNMLPMHLLQKDDVYDQNRDNIGNDRYCTWILFIPRPVQRSSRDSAPER